MFLEQERSGPPDGESFPEWDEAERRALLERELSSPRPLAGADSVGPEAEPDALPLSSYAVPKAVDPQCSFIRGRSGWVVTASGGVDINGFQVVENQQTDSKVGKLRSDALAASETNRWWWDK